MLWLHSIITFNFCMLWFFLHLKIRKLIYFLIFLLFNWYIVINSLYVLLLMMPSDSTVVTEDTCVRSLLLTLVRFLTCQCVIFLENVSCAVKSVCSVVEMWSVLEWPLRYSWLMAQVSSVSLMIFCVVVLTTVGRGASSSKTYTLRFLYLSLHLY